MKILHWITKQTNKQTKKQKSKLVKSRRCIFHSRLFLTRLQIFVICITCGVLRFKKILVNVYLKTDLILSKIFKKKYVPLHCAMSEIDCDFPASLYIAPCLLSLSCRTLWFQCHRISPPPFFFLLYYHENGIFWLNEKCLLFWLTQSSMTKTSLTQMCPRTSVQRILSITNDSVCLSSGIDVSKSP